MVFNTNIIYNSNSNIKQRYINNSNKFIFLTLFHINLFYCGVTPRSPSSPTVITPPTPSLHGYHLRPFHRFCPPNQMPSSPDQNLRRVALPSRSSRRRPPRSPRFQVDPHLFSTLRVRRSPRRGY